MHIQESDLTEKLNSNLKEKEVTALIDVLEYAWLDEFRDYNLSEDKDNHIYMRLVVITKWLYNLDMNCYSNDCRKKADDFKAFVAGELLNDSLW